MPHLDLTLADYSCYLMSLAVLYAILNAKVKSFLGFVFVSCMENPETAAQILTEGISHSCSALIVWKSMLRTFGRLRFTI